MKLQKFMLTVPEGREIAGGYIELPHNTQYSLIFTNNNYDRRCDVEVYIDGGHIGTWRINSNTSIRIERPVHDTGCFTFYRVDTSEAHKAGISAADETGLIKAIFKPEHLHFKPEPALMLDDRWEADGEIEFDLDYSAGGTGLSGRSKQNFTSATILDYDPSAFVTINLRLVCPISEPRPLFPKSTPVPALVRLRAANSFLVDRNYGDFASASRRAKELAMQFSEPTSIQRCSVGWAVLVSPAVLSVLNHDKDEYEYESVYDTEDYGDPYDDDHQREVIKPLIEEIQSDQDAFSRSEEDGWFYED